MGPSLLPEMFCYGEKHSFTTLFAPLRLLADWAGWNYGFDTRCDHSLLIQLLFFFPETPSLEGPVSMLVFMQV